MPILRMGTRDSPLALWQTNYVIKAIQEHAQVELSVVPIKELGDQHLDVPLTAMGSTSLFTKELEKALLAHEIDLAIHSLKDMQTCLPEGLCVGAVLERHDPCDVLIAKNKMPFSHLPPWAIIGTGSPRRQSQLSKWRPDLQFKELRGNIQTRLAKLDRGEYDAIVMAKAALDRLGLSHRISQCFSLDLLLPAVGQGVIAIETRIDDQKLQPLLQAIHHVQTGWLIQAERSFLRTLQGGCQAPIAGHSRIEEGALALYGLVSSLDGTTTLQGKQIGLPQEAETIGRTLAKQLLNKGADQILLRYE